MTTVAPSFSRPAADPPEGVIVYGPSVAGGALVPGDPSKTIGGPDGVQDEPLHVMLIETVWPVCMLVVVTPCTVVVWSTVQLPDVVQSPSTTFVCVTFPPAPAVWVES